MEDNLDIIERHMDELLVEAMRSAAVVETWRELHDSKAASLREADDMVVELLGKLKRLRARRGLKLACQVRGRTRTGHGARS